MARPPRAPLAVACLVLLAAAGCGVENKAGQPGHEPAREGLSIPLGGVNYNVFITRELNVNIPPDQAYYDGPPARRGEVLYGVFLQACNQGDRPVRTARRFHIVDSQGNEFEPVELPESNAFAYNPTTLQPKQCQPQAGSVAQLGPTAGSMLLFRLPLPVTENRPLELEIRGPYDYATGKRESKHIELDL